MMASSADDVSTEEILSAVDAVQDEAIDFLKKHRLNRLHVREGRGTSSKCNLPPIDASVGKERDEFKMQSTAN